MGKKLILVTDSKVAKLYNASGFKIKDLIATYNADELGIHHKKQSIKTGFHKGNSSHSSHSFSPHSEPKSLDRKQFCKEIVLLLQQIVEKDLFSELIIIAEPKSLGEIRNNLNGKLKDIKNREIAKDLVHSKNSEIEQIAFS